MSQEAEKAFFDDQVGISARQARIGQFYSIIRSRVRDFENILLADCRGRTVLEYGCGRGSYAFQLAAAGAEVTGIDISPESIETANAQAAEKNLQGCSFLAMDAEAMTFPDHSFDLVCGVGILHHLQLDRALPELARVMKPSGRAVFMEPLGCNPLIQLFRRLTPDIRTENEHPLVRRDLKLLRRHFPRSTFRFYHLTSFGAMPFLKTRLFFSLVNLFDRLDQGLFRLVPPLGPLGWYAVFQLENAAIDGERGLSDEG